MDLPETTLLYHTLLRMNASGGLAVLVQQPKAVEAILLADPLNGVDLRQQQ